MCRVYVMEETAKRPITLIGECAGICYGSNTIDDSRNHGRGLGCLETNHGRTLEYPQIYLVIEGYSARVIRELYTHIGGAPTRLQASTRYINYDEFNYIIPPAIQDNEDARFIFEECMESIATSIHDLESIGIKKEDAAMLLPLGMESKVVIRTNLRQLIDMSHTRLCGRAYWEFRKLMKDIINALKEYSNEWRELDSLGYFCPKCDLVGYCTETKSCGRRPKLGEMEQ